MKLPKEENVLYSGHGLISQSSQELYQSVPVQRQDIIQTSGLCNDIPTTSKRRVRTQNQETNPYCFTFEPPFHMQFFIYFFFI